MLTLQHDAAGHRTHQTSPCFFISHSTRSSDDWPGVYEELRWSGLLCCHLTSANLSHGEGGRAGSTVPSSTSISMTGTASSAQCLLQNSTAQTSSSLADCLDILCRLDSHRPNLICHLNHRKAAVPNGLPVVSMRLLMHMSETHLEETHLEETNGVAVCGGDDAVTCSISLHSSDVTVSLSINASAATGSASSLPILIATRRLRRPDPPIHLHYSLTTEGEVLFAWNSSRSGSDPVTYQLRYSANTSLSDWQIVMGIRAPWVRLTDLRSGVRYIVQVRCQNQYLPESWSDWSRPLYVTLDISYLPAEVFAAPGSAVTVYAVFHNRSWSADRAVWLLNGHMKLSQNQYRAVNDRVSAASVVVGQPGFDTLMCCQWWGDKYQCIIAYAKIYTTGLFDAGITCQTNQNLRADTMVCRWNKSVWAQVRFLYRWYDGPCEDMPGEEDTVSEMGTEGLSEQEECSEGPGDFIECSLRDLRLISCYKLWLEVMGGNGKVRSLPVFITPIDHVKPAPPSVVDAVTLSNGTLRVGWRRPDLPAYDLLFHLRYAPVRERADTAWKVIGPLFEPWAEAVVPDPCAQYRIEVRCTRLNGSGFWSDWSKPHYSAVLNSKAPEYGPDFWRILEEDPAKNQTNVTLIFKSLPVQESACCVETLIVQHQVSGGAVWSNRTALGSSHTFQWTDDVHTVSVLAQNSAGMSAKNSNLTLVRQPKYQYVTSFSAVANASCVSLSWTLRPGLPTPQSFVVDWLDQSQNPDQSGSAGTRVEWVRIRPTQRALHLCRHFYGNEEFTLHVVFVDGEGEPVKCTVTRHDPAVYILVMVIGFLSMVLFVTLISSQNQMKKLMWKDVPNPNNCSWAQGVDFRKMENVEHLFRHPEGLIACPLLLLSEHISEAEIVEKPRPLTLDKDRDGETALHESVGDGGKVPSPLPPLDDPVDAPSLEASSLAVTPETSGQSSVTYATVLLSEQPAVLHKQPESLSSDEGNFSANNSDISGSFPGGLWDLDNPQSSEELDLRHSCSFNSIGEFSDNSEQDDEAVESTGVAKDLYFLGTEGDEGDDEDNDGDDEEEPFRNEDIVVCAGSSPLLGRRDSKTSNSSCVSQKSILLYLPQFRTASCKPVGGDADDGTPQP
ncbi:leptin receptor [Chanos chanos]|uniref:Leptin receptor n=1 Tax=Chanos chanos TaxID=29144 RepID=A0A6J2WN68_CHACN|nr:leptin receptor [Chanos chanos]